MLSVATLVWFVHHIAAGINVETVVDAVHDDLCDAIQRHTLDSPDVQSRLLVPEAGTIPAPASGYLQAVDRDSLADWAHEHGVLVTLRVRPGDYVPAGFPVAHLSSPIEDATGALGKALTFGHRPAALQDLEYAVRQLSEVAVRALSPGINDPFTAGSVTDHLGDALCRLAPRHLPSGLTAREGRIVLVQPVSDYAGLCDAMLHMIRQNAAGSVHVLARMLEVLTHVAEVERQADRRVELRRHADLVIAAARRDVIEPADLVDLEKRHRRFEAVTSGHDAPALNAHPVPDGRRD